jgi:hypothetical protein
MASYDYDIANLALARLGQGQIVSLAQAGRDAEVCNLFYTQNRDYCLGLTDWVATTSKVHMIRAGKISISDITAAEPPVLTCTGHVFVTGDLITVEDALGMTEINDGIYVVDAYTSLTVTLHDTEGVDVVGTGWTAYTSSGYAYRHPGNNWEYIYDLPSGCLKVLGLMDENFGESDSYEWERQKDLIYCDVDYAAVKYLPKESTVTTYDNDLVELMAARLAWLICPRVSNDKSLKTTLNQEWLAIAGRGQMTNAEGSQNDERSEDLWINAR